jgi:hypothetical protein
MSDRKLRLVPPPVEGSAAEPPFDEAELRGARALAEALERGEEPLASALAAAWSPAALSPEDGEALLARALGDAEAPPTRAEHAAAERLRDALSGGQAGAPELELVAALRAAHHPAPIDSARNDELVDAALRRADATRGAPAAAAGPRPVGRAPAGAARALRLAATAAGLATAMAAGFALFSTTRPEAPPSAAAPVAVAAPLGAALIPARSTEELFDATEPFPRAGGESARIDRIASARGADLRANRFAAWGVR